MNDDNEQPHELPDGLSELVAGLVAEPVPDDLKQQIRSRLGARLDPRPAPARIRKYVAVAAAITVVAAIVAAAVFLLPSGGPPVVMPVSIDVVAVTPATDPHPIRRQPHAGPSLWTYHRASHDSVDQIDVLLGEHAALVLSANHASRQAAPLTTSQFLEDI